jgi:Tfp pilus assembly protein PilE
MKRLRISGFSVTELILAAAVVGILTTLVFAAYAAGLKSLFKSQAQNQLLSEMQILARRMGTALQQSTLPSVSISADQQAIAFLTSYDEDGQPQFGAFAEPDWDGYLIFYLDNTDQMVKMNRVNLRATSSQKTRPTPIAQFNPGRGGPKPIDQYRKDGKVTARFIKNMTIELLPSLPGGYRFQLEAEKPQKGNRSASRSTMEFSVVVRN